jgi:hypothetical protein
MCGIGSRELGHNKEFCGPFLSLVSISWEQSLQCPRVLLPLLALLLKHTVAVSPRAAAPMDLLCYYCCCRCCLLGFRGYSTVGP